MVMSATMATMPVMLMQIVPTLLVLIFVPVRKDTLEMESHTKVIRIIISIRRDSYSYHNLVVIAWFSLPNFVFMSVYLFFQISTSATMESMLVTCINTNGSHNCICNKGYFGNGKSCQGIYNSLWQAETPALETPYYGKFALSTQLIKVKLSSN